jgi:hypothetical protein
MNFLEWSSALQILEMIQKTVQVSVSAPKRFKNVIDPGTK